MSKNGFTFESLQPLLAESLPQDYGILLTYANRIPPHIGFCQNGIYYSLSNNSPSKPQPFGKILRLIDQKKIPSIFVHLQNPESRPSQDSMEHLLLKAPPIQAGGSCLVPVRGMIEEFWNIQIEKPLIHGLLHQLESEHLIRKTWFRHLDPAWLHEQSYTMPFYDGLAVKNHLLHLISGS